MANERQAARKAKDFARADALRKALQERGWVVEDTPAGPRLKQLTPG
jgi:cysteinyl-tRNA synthetase